MSDAVLPFADRTQVSQSLASNVLHGPRHWTGLIHQKCVPKVRYYERADKAAPGEGKHLGMATTSTERLRDLEVYTHDDGRRYVFDMRIPPGDVQYVTRVEPRPGLSVWVEFQSGARGTVDLSDIADATPDVAELWSDRDYFETVHVADGGVAWKSNLYDISPMVLYMRVTGKQLDEVFPQVRFLD